MSAIPYEGEDRDWEDSGDADELGLPGRPRRRFWGRGTAALLAVILCAVAFYGGVRVEKAQLSSATSTVSLGGTGARGGAGGLASGMGSRFWGGGAGAGAAGATGATGAAGATGAGAAAAGGGSGTGFGGNGGFLRGGLGGGNASFGTVSTIAGNTIYITDPTTGNTIKVTLSSVTKITKSVGVSKSALRPGDTVVIQGLKQSNGSISATSVSDAGVRSAAGGSGGGGSGGGGGGGAVSSLFGGGG